MKVHIAGMTVEPIFKKFKLISCLSLDNKGMDIIFAPCQAMLVTKVISFL